VIKQEKKVIKQEKRVINQEKRGIKENKMGWKSLGKMVKLQENKTDKIQKLMNLVVNYQNLRQKLIEY